MVLIWNERRVEDIPFLAAYEELLRRHAPEYCLVDHRNVDHEALDRFFQHHQWRQERLPNQQVFDREGLEGRVRSSSYVPLPGTSNHDRLFEELRALFEEYQERRSVAFLYDTLIHFGRLTAVAD